MACPGVGEQDQYRGSPLAVEDTVDYRSLPQVGEAARPLEADKTLCSSVAGASLAGLGSIWAPTMIGRPFPPGATAWRDAKSVAGQEYLATLQGILQTRPPTANGLN